MTNDDKRPGGADSFDVIVIGGGPAGYPTAIRAAQNKLTVACIDEWKNRDGSAAFGGTCLNAGCIPSKALLESTELYHRLQEEFATHGIKVSGAQVDLAQMQKRKAGIVRAMTQGIVALFKAAGVTPLQGHGRLLARSAGGIHRPRRHATRAQRAARGARLGLGADRAALRGLPGTAHRRFLGRARPGRVPKRLGVIGAGVIGLELGSVWRRLGAEVVVLEALPDFLAFADQQLAKEALRHFKKQGLDIRLGAKVSGATVKGGAVEVTYADAKGEQHADGRPAGGRRRPPSRTARICSAAGTGVELDERGFIKVDHSCRTGGRGRLGGRRLRARSDAGAQGQGGGRDGRRPDRRAATARSTTRSSRRSSTPRPRSPGSASPRSR